MSGASFDQIFNLYSALYSSRYDIIDTLFTASLS